MQTSFTLAQLADPDVAEADKILRACVHCGFCTATCPTYVLLGDELDSPRGRIYLIKDMLENDRPATADVAKHVDRCLSCLACMTTCPSGVHYMHLVDHARAHVEETYRRPLADRLMRALLANLLPYPGRFRVALAAGWFAGPVAKLVSWMAGGANPPAGKAVPVSPGWRGIAQRVVAMLGLMPARLPNRSAYERAQTFSAQSSERKGRIALLQGCAQSVLGPQINEAAIRLLTRHGIDVVLAADEACCGSLVHHMGREHQALAQARHNIDVWSREMDAGLDTIVITASGCGTTIKDYGYMLRNDPAYAAKAARVSALAKDISEYLAGLDLGVPVFKSGLTTAYQSACSLQHGQKITRQPKDLLAKAGFHVRDIADAHLCCGSAGTYNIMQPDIARALRDRKVANIERTGADVIATGNIGCMTHIAEGTSTPIVHTVELLDWAYGGPLPDALKGVRIGVNDLSELQLRSRMTGDRRRGSSQLRKPVRRSVMAARPKKGKKSKATKSKKKKAKTLTLKKKKSAKKSGSKKKAPKKAAKKATKKSTKKKSAKTAAKKAAPKKVAKKKSAAKKAAPKPAAPAVVAAKPAPKPVVPKPAPKPVVMPAPAPMPPAAAAPPAEPTAPSTIEYRPFGSQGGDGNSNGSQT